MPLDRIFNIYLLMFFLPLVFMLLRFNQRKVLYLITLVYSVLIGFRHEVGCDWNNYLGYLEMLNMAGSYGFWDYLNFNDKGYMFLNWIAYHYGGGIYLVNFICALLFMYGLVRFVRLEPNPLLALLVATPYLIVVVAMGYTRQSVAIGFILLALSFYYERRLFWVISSLTLATLFHKTALVAFFPLFLLPKDIVSFRNKVLTAFLVFILFYFLVLPSIKGHLHVYFGLQFESAGGAIRMAMNLLPAILFLFFRHRLSQERHIFLIMFWTSLFSIISFPLVFKWSTLTDRLGLYLVPLQFFVFNRIVNLFEGKIYKRLSLAGVILYYLSVLLVWLIFAKHSHCWIPYKFGIWEVFKR